MKIIVAPDSFKGSLSAGEACGAISVGVRRVKPKAEIVEVPMADGGEGTVDALVASTDGHRQSVIVRGPLGDETEAVYGILGDGGATAVVEMAAAAGLPLVPAEKRNPVDTTTYGLGQLILDALERGCRDIIIGIGGSATNDCGTGMAQAMGVKFFDEQGNLICERMTGGLMGGVSDIDVSALPGPVEQCNFVVACDVTNPLLGPNGASHVYGPQKGGDSQSVQTLEANMSRIITLVEEKTRMSVRNVPGAGAAGGLGAGLMAFLGGKLEPGVDIVMRYCRFSEKIESADLIITGEGRVDETTVSGKTISGIVRAAKEKSIPVVVLAGSVACDPARLIDMGARAVLPICPGPVTVERSMRDGARFLTDTAEQLMRLIMMNTDKI